MRILLLAITFVIMSDGAQAQLDTVPQWFKNDLEIHIGTWYADNSVYMSDEEPFDQFGMQWTLSIGGTAMNGRLFGLKDGMEVGTFWEFKEYWDPVKGRAIVQQFGYEGVVGSGVLEHKGNGRFECLQKFGIPGGKQWESLHVTEIKGNTMTSTSFEKDESGVMKQGRFYTWVKK